MLAPLIARSAGWLSRRLGRGGGTTLPGVILLKLQPNAITELAADLDHGSVLISATNGKTTTTRLLASAFEAAGYQLVSNTQGSNLERGVATALLDADHANLGLFEVDEAALDAIAAASNPQVIVLMNLFRDQLDRYGELETLVDKWRDLLLDLATGQRPPTLVINADDPNLAALGREYEAATASHHLVWFGLDDVSHALEARAHAADATTCRSCASPIDHSAVFIGHLGHWACTNCDAHRPTPSITASSVQLNDSAQSLVISSPEGMVVRAETVDVTSALPGLHNSYNIVAAFAASWALANRRQVDHGSGTVAAAIGRTQAAFGRGETVAIGDKQLQLLLAKNPTGVNQNIRTVLASEGQLDVLVLLNDRTADGQDVSWIWDVDWEPLQSRLASLTIGGDRAWDLALRFRYAGFDMDHITVELEPATALDAALAATPAAGTLHALPTYTAMLDLRSVLTDRGHTQAYWEDA